MKGSEVRWIEYGPVLGQGLANFSVKGQEINILSFVGRMVSVTTTQFCCSRKAAVDNK